MIKRSKNFAPTLNFIPKTKLNIGQLTLDDYLINEKVLYDNIINGFDEAVNSTKEWLQSPEAETFFYDQQDRLTTFFNESGINEEWNNIIEKRANKGVDLTEQIYDYARKINMENYLLPYTRAEKLTLNKLCDYNYELITNVTRDQISGIRHCLIEDYSKGLNPRNSTLFENLDKIKLEPVNYLSPIERAEMIARTESARALNSSTLETYRIDGITMVSLYNPDQCDECAEYDKPTPIDEALEIGVVHPNCRCTWIPETEVS